VYSRHYYPPKDADSGTAPSYERNNELIEEAKRNT
jgi:hypothetical protein